MPVPQPAADPKPRWRFQKRFTVRASQAEVARFHANTEGFKALAPPLVPMKIHNAPDPLGEGAVLDFTMWLGPIPVYWESLIHDVSADGFTDTQGRGPFTYWQHRHSFEKIDEGSTLVIDRIEATPRLHVLWGPVCLMMWLGLPFLFTYRGWSTKRRLEKKA